MPDITTATMATTRPLRLKWGSAPMYTPPLEYWERRWLLGTYRSTRKSQRRNYPEGERLGGNKTRIREARNYVWACLGMHLSSNDPTSGEGEPT